MTGPMRCQFTVSQPIKYSLRTYPEVTEGYSGEEGGGLPSLIVEKIRDDLHTVQVIACE